MTRGKPSIIEALRAVYSKGDKLLLAVSGGSDSMALLHATSKIARQYSLTLHVAHIDHQLRTTSAKDAAFVSKAANSLGWKFHLLKATPPKEKRNIEAWGRQVRYDFFEKIRSKHNLDWIVTAHHGNDVAETLIMRLIQNREPTGIVERDIKRRLLRPLLTIPKDIIKTYLKTNNIQYVNDVTNNDTTFLRNKIRLKLIPYLMRNYDPRIVEVLVHRSRSIDEDIEYLEKCVEPLVEKTRTVKLGSKEWLRLVVQELIKLPVALQWRFIENLFLPICRFELGRTTSKRVVEFLKSNSTEISLPGKHTIRRSGGGLLFSQTTVSKLNGKK